MKVWAIVNDRNWSTAYRDLRDLGIVQLQHGSIGPKDGETFVVLTLGPTFTAGELETDPDILQAGPYHDGDNPVSLGLWPDSDPSWIEQGSRIANALKNLPSDVAQGAREGVRSATTTALLMAGGIGLVWLAMKGKR